MLGAWPCGKIVMLGELFGAESKAQVYALFHAFLQQNSETTDDISKQQLFIVLCTVYTFYIHLTYSEFL